MIGVSLTRTRLSTRLGLSIGDVVATLLNTRDFTNLRPIDVQGFAQFVQALDAQLTAKGRPYTGDPVDVEVTGRLLSVVTVELQALVNALPVVDPDPEPEPSTGGGVIWSGVTWSGVVWPSGAAPTSIIVTVGAIAPGAEGSGTTGITVDVGPLLTAPEGNPSQAITVDVGGITSSPEGSPITISVGAISPVAEGNN